MTPRPTGCDPGDGLSPASVLSRPERALKAATHTADRKRWLAVERLGYSAWLGHAQPIPCDGVSPMHDCNLSLDLETQTGLPGSLVKGDMETPYWKRAIRFGTSWCALAGGAARLVGTTLFCSALFVTSWPCVTYIQVSGGLRKGICSTAVAAY